MALSPFLGRGNSDSFFRDAFREADDFFANFLPGGAMMVPMTGGDGGLLGAPNRAGGPGGAVTQLNKVIPVDVSETKDAYQLKADIPGVKKEEVSLDVDGNIIRIGAKRSSSESVERDSPDKRWHRSERREYSEYQTRALRMPENADLSKMTAAYDNGVLTIDVKKQPEQGPELKKIPIQ